MRSNLLLAAAISGGASMAAAADTANLFYNGIRDHVVALSVGEDASATTWHVGCAAKPTDGNDCGMSMMTDVVTLVQGPKTVSVQMPFDAELATLTQDLQCDLASTTSAHCIMTIVPGAGLSSYMAAYPEAMTGVDTVWVSDDAAEMFNNIPLITDARDFTSIYAAATGKASSSAESTVSPTVSPTVSAKASLSASGNAALETGITTLSSVSAAQSGAANATGAAEVPAGGANGLVVGVWGAVLAAVVGVVAMM